MKKLFKLNSKLHGVGKVKFAWQANGNFLATAGSNGLVHIFDRHGEQIDEIGLSDASPVLTLEWDADGETLAVLQQGNGTIPLWDLSSRTTRNLDTNLKDPTFIGWSKTGSLLAIGTVKGNLLIYNKLTRKKIPVLGKHPKRISCGCWSNDNMLALGSDDRTLTMSNESGDTIQHTELRGAPSMMVFGREKALETSKNPVQNSVGIAIGRSLLLYNIDDPEQPLELTFQARYGSIQQFFWVDEGNIILAFSEGFLVVVSTHPEEIGEELFSGRFFKEKLHTMAYSESLHYVAISGVGGIKVVDLSSFSELKADCINLTDTEDNEVDLMRYTNDGQILTVASLGGIVQNFLARMPNISDSFETSVAYVCSLREIAIVDVLSRENPLYIPVSIEPSFIALGPYHVAVGMNNRVWYYLCDSSTQGDTLVNEQEYMGSVVSVKMNAEYAAVLCEGKVCVHHIERDANMEQDMKVLPNKQDQAQEDAAVQAYGLTRDFLILGGQEGFIGYYLLREWRMLTGSDYRHECGILQLYPNRRGTRIIFIDNRHNGFVYNPVTTELVSIPNLGNNVYKIMWDRADRGCFAAVEPNEFFMYVYTPLTVNGAQVVKLGPMEIHDTGDFVIQPQGTKVLTGFKPILCHDGDVTCQQPTGGLTTLRSTTHTRLQGGKVTPDRELEAFRQNLTLLRLDRAWELATSINQREYWLALSGKAMECLDISLAIRVYRQLGDAGMVMGLERIQEIEDKNLLAGHVLMLFGEYSKAQELFLTSSYPKAALQMRSDLLHWDQALKLAVTLDSGRVPELSTAYAQQLEFKGDYERALRMYGQATSSVDNNGNEIECSEKLRVACAAGIARSTLRMGDLRRGIRLVLDAADSQLCSECGAILESMKQLSDAATLYEKGGQFEKAVTVYIQIKDLNKAEPLMKHVTAPKLHIQFARAKEALGDFRAAATSYHAANDMPNLVRMQLDKLNSPETAFDIVRQSKSSEGALTVATYCQDRANYSSAIEFLLMANREDEALDVAKKHDEIDRFADLLGDKISAEHSLKIAQHYEQLKMWAKSGEFYQICGNHHKALKLFLQCGEKELNKAIDVVGKARNDMLTHTLIDFLMGETDGVPKDPNFIFRLYMALGNFPQAAKTAIIISRQEQELGNYKVAHNVLFETHRELQLNKIRTPQTLRQALMLLHSYVLVKKHVKLGDHLSAARMLIRVSRNVSKFPTHTVNILTSTVIECQRANLKAQAYEFATILMRPEYRQNIEAKFKRKIEAIVRRPSKEGAEENLAPCPHCGTQLPATELDCTKCKNWIPYCIVTGRHVLREDCSRCPQCEFPTIHSAFLSFLDSEKVCPMCEKPVDVSRVVKLKTFDWLLGEDTEEDSQPEQKQSADGAQTEEVDEP